jgi:hypothetical protein
MFYYKPKELILGSTYLLKQEFNLLSAVSHSRLPEIFMNPSLEKRGEGRFCG